MDLTAGKNFGEFLGTVSQHTSAINEMEAWHNQN